MKSQIVLGICAALVVLLSVGFLNRQRVTGDPGLETSTVLVAYSSETNQEIREMEIPEGRIVFTYRWAVFVPNSE